MDKQRLIYIDIAKAITIVLVVIGHYYPDNHPVWYEQMRLVIYGFHMPLFMFSSGFVYMATFRKESYRSFIIRKVKRLMVPYIFVSTIVITIKLLTQNNAYVENPVTYMSYIRMLFLPEAGYFTWFVWVLWWIFLLVPLFNTMKKRLLLFIISTVSFFIPVSFPEIFCLREFKEMFLFFCIGCVVWDWRESLNFIKKIPAYIYIFTFLIANYVRATGLTNCIPGGNIVVAVFGIGLVVCLSRRIEKRGSRKLQKVLFALSSSSYVIYLFHTTFAGFAKAILLKSPILQSVNNDFMFLCSMIFVVTSGILFPLLLDIFVLRKCKYTKLLFGYK